MEKLKALTRLEESLAKLPSVGKRSAERMAYAMLNMDDEDLEEFSDAIKNLKQSIHVCPICGFLTDNEGCVICDDKERDQDTLMVVSFPKDVIAFENAEYYQGLYHVLNGVISLGKGGSVDDLNIDALCCCSITQLCNSFKPYGLQHARLLCPSPSPRTVSNSCPLNQ